MEKRRIFPTLKDAQSAFVDTLPNRSFIERWTYQGTQAGAPIYQALIGTWKTRRFLYMKSDGTDGIESRTETEYLNGPTVRPWLEQGKPIGYVIEL